MKIIVTDLKTCLGCHSCELACAISRSASKNLLGAVVEAAVVWMVACWVFAHRDIAVAVD